MQVNRFILSIVLLLIVLTAQAQIPLNLFSPDRSQQLGVNLSLEPELTTSLVYLHQLARLSPSLRVRGGVGLKVPPYKLADFSGQVSLVAALDWQKAIPWRGTLIARPYYARNQNIAGTLTGIGFEIRGQLLHQGKHWTNGTELSWQQTAVTYIHHSKTVQTTYQDRYLLHAVPLVTGPTDGWYGPTVNRFRLGYLGGRMLCRTVGWQLAAGCLVMTQRQGVWLSFAHAQLPAYVETGFQFAW